MPDRRHLNIFIITGILFLFSCTRDEQETVSWKPEVMNDGWNVSSLLEQDMDSSVIINLFVEAEQLDNLYSLLIVKNGYLIAERYFNGMTVNDAARTASVTKSIISALAGIAINEEFIESPDQKLKDFFPEIDWGSTDPKKSEITVEQILQMRSGYPWEEVYGYLETLSGSSNWIPFLKEFPLVHDPGTQFGYSNFTAHIMGIIIARSANQSLLSFGRSYLFNNMGISITGWPKDANGYYYGSGDIEMTPRNLAKFGQLFLDEGVWNDVQLIPSEWVNSSFHVYSSSTYGREILTNIRTLKYGYLWWSGTSGSHQIWFAWGHGGQMVVIIRDLNIVVVATALVPGIFDPDAWPKSKVVMELVGRFITEI
ncbi:MAG: serine hydrolase [Bacteroidales bacterium]|nr:serine hydrolase [Bacteroidales bacterium]